MIMGSNQRGTIGLLNWLQSLLAHFGYLAVFVALFINNTGIPFPGTTFLLGAGLLVGQGTLSLWATVAVATAACFLGTNCGYWLGLRFGQRVSKHIHWLRLTHHRIKH